MRECAFTNWLPWEGRGYRAGLLPGRRFLILGESHYWLNGNDRNEYFTIEVIQAIKRRRPPRFFSNICRMVAPNPFGDESAFWDRVAFANVVPGMVPKPNKFAPTPAQWRATPARYDALLRVLQPTHVLILGQRSWNALPAGRTVRALGGRTTPSGFGDVQAYAIGRSGRGLQTGIRHRVLTFQTHHPSVRGFKPKEWRPAVQTFLRLRPLQ